MEGSCALDGVLEFNLHSPIKDWPYKYIHEPNRQIQSV